MAAENYRIISTDEAILMIKALKGEIIAQHEHTHALMWRLNNGHFLIVPPNNSNEVMLLFDKGSLEAWSRREYFPMKPIYVNVFQLEENRHLINHIESHALLIIQTLFDEVKVAIDPEQVAGLSYQDMDALVKKLLYSEKRKQDRYDKLYFKVGVLVQYYIREQVEGKWLKYRQITPYPAFEMPVVLHRDKTSLYSSWGYIEECLGKPRQFDMRSCISIPITNHLIY